MIEVLFHDGFGLSGSEISEEEGGGMAYCYRGEASLTKVSVEAFGSINRLVFQASLWMNQRAIVKEQLEIL